MMKSVSLKLSDISAPSGPQNDRRGPESERSSAMIPDIFRILDQQHLHRPIRSKKASLWQRNKRCLDPTSAQPVSQRLAAAHLKGRGVRADGILSADGKSYRASFLATCGWQIEGKPREGIVLPILHFAFLEVRVRLPRRVKMSLCVHHKSWHRFPAEGIRG